MKELLEVLQKHNKHLESYFKANRERFRRVQKAQEKHRRKKRRRKK